MATRCDKAGDHRGTARSTNTERDKQFPPTSETGSCGGIHEGKDCGVTACTSKTDDGARARPKDTKPCGREPRIEYCNLTDHFSSKGDLKGSRTTIKGQTDT